ncbi:MAG TPA: hypothetical protein VFB80_03035 [Pirellulaceae bacterium]|nr:hypothetical protein [Pirellulaceae bacterium]
MVGRAFLGIGSLLLCVGGTSWGQQPTPTPLPSLADAARAAAANFKPVQASEVTAARSVLAATVSDLDRFLLTGASYKRPRWQTYLQWNDLVGLLQQDPPSPETSAAVLAKFRANVKGLELPQFANVATALERYMAASAAATSSNLKDEYAKQMVDLVTHLEAYEKDPTAGDAALAIGRSLAWLERNGQAAPLIADIRRTYGKQNLFGYASKRLAAAGIDGDVSQLTAVHDNILGTSLHGTAHLIGRTSVVMNENPRAASLTILLGGTAYSNTVGYNGPVTIYSNGATNISGQKTIEMTAAGLIGYRALASAATNSRINAIQAKHAFVERIAWKRAGQQKGQTEAIASQRAAGRAAGQMDSEAGRMVAEQNARYVEKFRDPLLKRGEFPEEMLFSSTSEQAQVRVLQASPALLAAPTVPPEQSADFDLALRTHESTVTNFGQGLLGGYELTDLRLEKLIKDDLKGELPDELRVTLPDGTLDETKDPWSILFAKELPVRAKFSGGGVWIAIRADGFTRGEGDTQGKYKPALTELVEISANYKIEKTEKGATLRRDGDVQVRFPARANPEQITLRDSPIVTFIRRKFRSMFKEEFVGEGLALKGRWEKAGKLQLQEVQSDKAWLALGWKLPAQAPPPPAAAGAE